MKTSRMLLVIAALVVAGIGYWLVRDRAPSDQAIPMLEGVPTATDAPREPAPETIESPSATATEPDSAAVAVDSGRTHADVPQLEVLLLDPKGRPVVDARIALFREVELLAQGATDSEGLVSWPPQAGEAEYAIAALGWEVVRGKVELSVGRKTITLVEGETIAGVALVDGAAAEPFALQWSAGEMAGDTRLPMKVYTALRRPGLRYFKTVALTQADGSFLFRGVRKGATGELSWSAPYFLRAVEHEPAARRMQLDAPRQDLLLELTEGCELRFRVVDPRGAPVPGAAVGVDRVATLATGERRSWSTQAPLADSEGRYSLAMTAEKFDECTVKVAAAGTTAWNTHRLTPPARLTGVWDVGDLATVEIRTLLVRVQDVQGAPIADATVVPWPPEATRKQVKTDAEGKLSIVVSAGLSQIAVSAFTYTSDVIALDTDATEVTVTLQGSCTLEFELSDPTRDPEGLSLELSGPSPVFEPDQRRGADGSMRRLPVNRTTEGLSSASAGSGDRQAMIVEPAKDKRWRVSAILPHQPLLARLRGDGTLVCELDVPPLAPGEHRKVTLPVPAARPLVVRVLSPELRPVPNAMISTESGDVVRMSTGKSVGANGELSFAWLHGERFDFVVTAKGFPAKRVRLSPIPEGRLDVVLDPPQSLEVELVQRDGTPYVGRVSFSANLPGTRSVEPTKLSDGLYRLDAMPTGDVLLSISGDFAPVYRFHRVGDPRLRIVIGAPESIEVTVSGKAGDDLGWMLEAATPGSSQGFARAGLDGLLAELPRATFHYLPPGEYDIWLVREESPFSRTFVRQGAPVRVVLDATHPNAKLDMEIPR